MTFEDQQLHIKKASLNGEEKEEIVSCKLNNKTMRSKYSLKKYLNLVDINLIMIIKKNSHVTSGLT